MTREDVESALSAINVSTYTSGHGESSLHITFSGDYNKHYRTVIKCLRSTLSRMQDTESLLSCPFCGEDNAQFKWYGEESQYVECGSCGVSTLPVGSEKEAYSLWNTRA